MDDSRALLSPPSGENTSSTSEKVLRTLSQIYSLLYGAAYCANGVLEAIQGSLSSNGVSSNIARYVLGILTATFAGITSLLSAAVLLYSIRNNTGNKLNLAERSVYWSSISTFILALSTMWTTNQALIGPAFAAMNQASNLLFGGALLLFLFKMINDFLRQYKEHSSGQPTTAPGCLAVCCPGVPHPSAAVRPGV